MTLVLSFLYKRHLLLQKSAVPKNYVSSHFVYSSIHTKTSLLSEALSAKIGKTFQALSVIESILSTKFGKTFPVLIFYFQYGLKLRLLPKCSSVLGLCFLPVTFVEGRPHSINFSYIFFFWPNYTFLDIYKGYHLTLPILWALLNIICVEIYYMLQ